MISARFDVPLPDPTKHEEHAPPKSKKGKKPAKDKAKKRNSLSSQASLLSEGPPEIPPPPPPEFHKGVMLPSLIVECVREMSPVEISQLEKREQEEWEKKKEAALAALEKSSQNAKGGDDPVVPPIPSAPRHHKCPGERLRRIQLSVHRIDLEEEGSKVQTPVTEVTDDQIIDKLSDPLPFFLVRPTLEEVSEDDKRFPRPNLLAWFQAGSKCKIQGEAQLEGVRLEGAQPGSLAEPQQVAGNLAFHLETGRHAWTPQLRVPFDFEDGEVVKVTKLEKPLTPVDPVPTPTGRKSQNRSRGRSSKASLASAASNEKLGDIIPTGRLFDPSEGFLVALDIYSGRPSATAEGDGKGGISTPFFHSLFLKAAWFEGSEEKATVQAEEDGKQEESQIQHGPTQLELSMFVSGTWMTKLLPIPLKDQNDQEISIYENWHSLTMGWNSQRGLWVSFDGLQLLSEDPLDGNVEYDYVEKEENEQQEDLRGKFWIGGERFAGGWKNLAVYNGEPQLFGQLDFGLMTRCYSDWRLQEARALDQENKRQEAWSAEHAENEQKDPSEGVASLEVLEGADPAPEPLLVADTEEGQTIFSRLALSRKLPGGLHVVRVSNIRNGSELNTHIKDYDQEINVFEMHETSFVRFVVLNTE